MKNELVAEICGCELVHPERPGETMGFYIQVFSSSVVLQQRLNNTVVWSKEYAKGERFIGLVKAAEVGRAMASVEVSKNGWERIGP